MRGSAMNLALATFLVLGCRPEQMGCAGSTEAGEAPVDTVRQEALTPADAEGAIEHRVSFPDAPRHYAEITTIQPAGGERSTYLMAVWTPGSYLVREFARHVENLGAATLDGDPLEVAKVTKNRWEVRAPEGQALPERVVLRYRLYAREASVRTNFIDADTALLNGACTFLVPEGKLDAPHAIFLELAEGWSASVTSLSAHPSAAGPYAYLARDFDELVDSPIGLGNPDLREWETHGATHVMATFGDLGPWDTERAVRDTERIVAQQHEFWGVVPYPRYVFFNYLFGGGGGGLEHSASTVMIADRWAGREPADWRGWLGLVSHEFFHTWNIKRLRPESLGPFDYENENYVRDLWVVEGITSYYDDLMLRRARLTTHDQYLEALGRNIGRVQSTPGRAVQSLSDSSFDAWIKFYRPDENTSNTGVSYYAKGSVVAFLLDQRIRELTNGGKSLDDVMRLAYERHAGERGYTTGEFRAVAEEVAASELDDFWSRYVDGTEEIDYEAALAFYGLQLAPVDANPDAPGWLGVGTGDHGGKVIVERVVRDSPAFDAGVNVDDELIAIGEERITGSIDDAMARTEPGEEVSLLLSRRGLLRRVELILGDAPRSEWTVQVDPDASPARRRARESWLGEDGVVEADEEAGEEAGEQSDEAAASGDTP